MKDKIVEEIHIAAGPERVFRAWTNQTLMVAWWGNADFRTTHWQGDVRQGGHWMVRFQDTRGNLFDAQGHYLRADAPNHLSFTWKPNWSDDPPTTIELDFRHTTNGTALKLTQTGFTSPLAYEQNKRAWAPTIAMLRRYLERS